MPGGIELLILITVIVVLIGIPVAALYIWFKYRNQK